MHDDYSLLSGIGPAQEIIHWAAVGPYGGQIAFLAIDPQDNSIIYSGAWSGDGLFKSTDNGEPAITDGCDV